MKKTHKSRTEKPISDIKSGSKAKRVKRKNGRAIFLGLPNREIESTVNPVGKISKPKKKMTGRRLFSMVGVFIVMFSLLAATGITLLWGYIFADFKPDKSGQLDIPTDALTHAPPLRDDITNILLIGSDSRNPDKEYGLSDSLIILTIDSKNKVIKMTSIMRDSFAYIPGRKEPNKINAAYAYGGPELALRTVNNTFRLNIEYYISVNMENMGTIIDIAGGLDVNVTKAEMSDMNKSLRGKDRINGPGLQHLNGTQAVRYARVRKVDSDIKRTERQREILGMLYTIFRKANIVSKTQMIQKGLSLINTNLTARQITSLGLDVLPKMASEIQQLRLPIDGYYRVSTSRGWHMIVDYNGMIPLIYDFIYGEKLPFDPVPTIKYIPGSTTKPTAEITVEPTKDLEPTTEVTIDPELTPEITGDSSSSEVSEPEDEPTSSVDPEISGTPGVSPTPTTTPPVTSVPNITAIPT